jgi:hypothetical protein
MASELGDGQSQGATGTHPARPEGGCTVETEP